MTRISFLIVLGCIIALQAFYFFYTFFHVSKYNYTSSIAIAFLSTALTITFYGLTLIFQNKNLVNIFYSIYFASIDWLLFAVFDFGRMVIYKANQKKIYRIVGRVYLLLTVADTLSFFMNIFYQTAFSLSGTYNQREEVINWTVNYLAPYRLHLFLCYAIVVPMIYVLVRNALKAQRFFKYKYLVIFLPFASYFILNGVFLVFHWPIDYSMLMFLPMSTELFLMAFVYLPRGILDNMLLQASQKMSNGVAFYDLDGHCIFLNDFCEEIFGQKAAGKAAAEEYLKKWETDFLSEADNDRNEIFTYNNELEIHGEPHIVDIEFHKQFDKRKRFVGSYLRFADRTDDIKNLEAEKYKATHDPLTGLLNKEGFFDSVGHLMDEEPDVPRCMICTDFYNFKLINDIFGKEVGDRVLKFEAKVLRNVQRKVVYAGRISGDKFALIMNKSDFNAPQIERYTRGILNLNKNANYNLKMYIGVYDITDSYESVISMYDKAHLAIESIQGDYDKMLAFYDTRLMQNLIEEKNLLREFPAALENDQIKMYLQPQISAVDHKIIGGEALVRWIHPEKGFLPPDKFVKILEKNGSIYEMDYFIWESAARKLSEWKNSDNEKFRNLSISVNISTKDFYHSDLYKVFTGLVKKYDISPSSLKLEVTETVIVQNVDIFRNVLKKLRNYGFIIEMDDFGSGYSSLNALMDFSMDVLKIDMEFLRKSENEVLSEDVIVLIIKLAKSLKMQVITEGVEKQEHVDFLTKSGCDIFQGYYFAKPMPVADAEKMIISEGE